MRIVTPSKIEQVAWEGYLEPLGEVSKGAHSRVRVTLGEPVWWSVNEAMESKVGEKWVSPVGDKRYILVRLACTLHPPSGRLTRYTEATLKAYLRPRQEDAGAVLAHDLYPQRLTVDSKGKMALGLLGEGLNFIEGADINIMQPGIEIEYQQVFPVVQGFGLGESNPYWRFAHHAKHPLLGSQFVYLVVATPPNSRGVQLVVKLIATLQTRWGPIRLGIPEDARIYISRTIGEVPIA